VAAMGMMTDLVHPITGPQRVVSPIVRMSATPTVVARPAPVLAQHSREVLLGAGLSDDEITSLLQHGIISQAD
ncbi:MAG: hypothetical protein ACRDG3_07870, partial [Tepidiformaceae bacterium]